ncbi:TLC domain-containing protein 2-like [Thalassophryne amazonica]|uniref:TLC domain-containing protein 2-like n=1 Tax=Thalassophryne amazonica TaxID=390379 RepID=UPI0014711507|nr:TLC domain-containing protein 2-like [Thalassophryne amazonica]
MELSSVFVTTGGSVGFFSLVNAGVGRMLVPESVCGNASKWRNICTSFVHSLVTAIWAVLCFFLHPQMAEDLIETHSVFSHMLVSFSIGYFIYDFLDMVLNRKLCQSWELLFHHMVVGIPLLSHEKIITSVQEVIQV